MYKKKKSKKCWNFFGTEFGSKFYGGTYLDVNFIATYPEPCKNGL